ncbi:MAG: class I SAM-dependent methyltransferase [Nitrososphaerota archaeon]
MCRVEPSRVEDSLRPLYRELAEFYEKIEERDYEAEISLIDKILRRHRVKSLIDLGCGTGLHVRELARRGYNGLGIDISPAMIRIAKRRAQGLKNARFITADYYSYRPASRFDGALCLNWSIPVALRDVDRFFSNVSRLLKEGGVLIIDYEKPGDIVWSDVGRPIIDSWSFKDGLIVRVSVGQIRRRVMRSRDVYIVFGRAKGFIPPREKERYLGRWRDVNVAAFLDISHVRFYEPKELERIAHRHGFASLKILSLKTRRGYRRLYNIFIKSGKRDSVNTQRGV